MPPAPNRTPPARILIVDDNDYGLRARRGILSQYGHEIVTSQSAEEALDLVSKQSFDVVVTDFKMPGMDGVQFISQLRKLNIETPVILISGFTDPLGLTPENTGADAVIQKSNNEVAHLLREMSRLLKPRPRKSPTKKPPGSEGSGSDHSNRKADGG